MNADQSAPPVGVARAAAAGACPYDSDAYARCLAYLGEAEKIRGLPWPVIIRAVPGSDRCDAIGPWPYASPPQAEQAPIALEAMRARGVVSFAAFLRPDRPVDVAGLRGAGIDCVRLKDHFAFDARHASPLRGRTRRYLAAARRQWTVRPLDLGSVWPRLAALHHDLSLRRSMSQIALVDARHFERLAEVPGAIGLGAFAGDELAAALVAVRTETSVYLHAAVGDERAYRTRGFYALYDEALRGWGADALLCIGGIPGGPDGPGIETFKRQFATFSWPVMMLKAVLDPAACAALAACRGEAGFFPPYRTPAG